MTSWARAYGKNGRESSCQKSVIGVTYEWGKLQIIEWAVQDITGRIESPKTLKQLNMPEWTELAQGKEMTHFGVGSQNPLQVANSARGEFNLKSTLGYWQVGHLLMSLTYHLFIQHPVLHLF